MRIAQRCFEWVRDEIRHTQDHSLQDVTCTASEVLEAGHGFCYAKSHLLAALLRANGIPTGFCYQRLALDANGASHCLHGLNAIHLPNVGWYRVDARGNRPGVDAQFEPPVERLAFSLNAPGEADLPEVWVEPLPLVVQTLRRFQTAAALSEALPDLPLWGTQTR
jgi:transglutaminase-like putative cysteine protease